MGQDLGLVELDIMMVFSARVLLPRFCQVGSIVCASRVLVVEGFLCHNIGILYIQPFFFKWDGGWSLRENSDLVCRFLSVNRVMKLVYGTSRNEVI